MVITSVTTGSWFPRTKLHLKEYDTFLRTGASHLPLDAEKLKALRSGLGPEDVSYNGARFDFVHAMLVGNDVAFYEDGLLILSHPAGNDVAASVQELRAFYEHRLAPALAYLYSLGSPLLSQRIPHIGKRPIIIVATDATDAEVATLVHDLHDAVHFVARQDGVTVHFGDNVLVVVHDAGHAELANSVVRSLILFRECEHKLRHYLDLHRTIWESIADIHNKEPLRIRDLPEIRDRLVAFKRDLTVSRTRLGQMRTYLPARKREIDDLGMEEVMRGLEAYRFEKVDAAWTYMNELWHMLEDYIESTVQITDLMYQENLQREINFQQFIFLVAAVAATLELGALTGATVHLTDPSSGAVLTGRLLEFNLGELMLFGGITLMASILIFNLIRPLIGSFRRIRTKDLFRGIGSVQATKDHDSL